MNDAHNAKYYTMNDSLCRTEQNKMAICLIVAADKNGAIATGDGIPWHLPSDLDHFKKTTKGNAVIMGRKTFESIGRPLPDRVNIVLTKNKDYDVTRWNTGPSEAVVVAHTTEQALILAHGSPMIFIIGGGEIYEAFFEMASSIIYTEVDTEIEAADDTVYFPYFKDTQAWKLYAFKSHRADARNDHAFTIKWYSRPS